MIEEENHVEEVNHEHGIGDVLERHKLSRKKLVKPESFDLEAANFTSYQGPGSHQVNIFFLIFFLSKYYYNYFWVSEKLFKVHAYACCRLGKHDEASVSEHWGCIR